MADATRRVSVRLSLDDGARVKQQMREVGESGQRSLEQITGGAEQASRALNLLELATRAGGVLGLASGLRALVSAGDALTQSFFRLQNAVGSVQAAGAIYEQLYRNALQTGVAVSEGADAFQRFSVAARSIGATNEQVVRLITGLQRSAIVSGASAQEVGSATLQLAQGLSSGVLQGDELRALLESMPLLAEGLARELGVGVGELRKMGSEGRLTSDVVFPALLRATEQLGRQLEQAPLTVVRGFQQLQVSTTNFLGQLDSAIGLSRTLGAALGAAARVLDGVRQGAGLVMPSEVQEGRRRQLAGVDSQIALAEAGAAAPAARRGSIRAGLVGVAAQQAGGDDPLVDLRRQRAELMSEIDTEERDATIRGIEERERAEQRAAESRRARAAADLAQLRPQLDARFRITAEAEERLTRLNAAASAGAIDAAERDRLAALAIRERDEALGRLDRTVQRTGARARAVNDNQREAERDLNELIRERERLIQNNENAQERYERRLSNLGDLVARADQAGRPVPDETIAREANAALEDLNRVTGDARRETTQTNDVARDLGLTLSSAFEDAIVRGKSLRDVVKGIGEDLLRVGTRRLVTEPLVGALSGVLAGVTTAGIFHEGGMVGAGGRTGSFPAALWAGAPRYHQGGWPGLANDEVPAILQRGERVLSREEVRRGGGGGIVMNITTPDASSFRASQGQILGDMNRAMARGRRSV